MLDKRKFYIDGKWVAPSKPNDFEVINPSYEEPCAIISLGCEEDVNLAVKAAQKSFSTWRETSKEERVSLIQKLYEIYKSRWDEMSKSISSDACLSPSNLQHPLLSPKQYLPNQMALRFPQHPAGKVK